MLKNYRNSTPAMTFPDLAGTSAPHHPAIIASSSNSYLYNLVIRLYGDSSRKLLYHRNESNEVMGKITTGDINRTKNPVP
jgi:hypothetical protein